MNAPLEPSITSPEGRAVEGVTHLPGTVAALLGWVFAGAVNALSLCFVPLGRGGVGGRLLHHFFDFGHTLALGLGAFGAVALVTRFGPQRPRLRILLLAAASVVGMQLLLAEDLAGAAERIAGPDARWPVILLCSLASLPFPIALAVTSLPARLAYRAPALALGAAAILANERVLVNGYPDIHVWFAACGATFLGAAASGLPLGSRLGKVAGRLDRKRSRVVLAVLAAFALVALVVPPTRGVELAMLERDTAFLVAPLGELHSRSSSSKRVRVPRELQPWFTPRAGRKDIPPSPHRLLPPGGIVVVVTIDALRADALGKRYQKRLPNFTDMMRRGVSFTEARSAGSGTRVSLAALLAGRYDSQLRWNHAETRRATLELDRLPRLPDLLEPYGVHTVSAVDVADSLHPDVGVITGFEEMKIVPDQGKLKGSPEVVEHLLGTLKRQGPGSLFYYTHLLDPHFPYYRHREGPRGPEEAYHQEVEYVDGFIGKIRSAIKEYGLANRTMFIVSADHGEGFGEHGLRGHGKLHYDVMVHVPLIVEGPGLKPRKVTTPVSMMDIGPTVLDLLGAPTPGYFMGESLVPMLRGEDGPKHRPTYAGAAFGETVIFQDKVKVILRTRPPTEEVYDLKKDPKEESNLRDTPEGEKRTALARAYTAAHRWPNGVPPRPLR